MMSQLIAAEELATFRAVTADLTPFLYKENVHKLLDAINSFISIVKIEHSFIIICSADYVKRL